MFTTALIDDERLALTRLRRLIADHSHVFDIVGEASNGEEGLALLETKRPALIFLDIEMPGINGFEMLKRSTHLPLVIFATAYDRFAIQAFEENSLDYLLKPIEPERLQRTVDKLQRLQQQPEAPALTQSLLRDLLTQMQAPAPAHTVAVKIGDRVLLIRPEEIAYFEADEKYTFLHTRDGRKHLTDYTLSELAQRLPAFARVSRSALINRDCLREIVRGFSGKYTLVLNDDAASKIASGQKYHDAIRALMR